MAWLEISNKNETMLWIILRVTTYFKLKELYNFLSLTGPVSNLDILASNFYNKFRVFINV